MLILAGVTIAQIAGNDSAPNKAVEARQKNEQGAEFDAIKLAAVSSIAEGDYDLYVDVPTLRTGLTGLIQEDPAEVITTVATVSGNGTTATVTILAKGTTNITATISGVENPGTCTLKVVDPMSNASLTAITIDEGDTAQITVPDSIEDIASCSSGDTSRVTVTNAGEITGVLKTEANTPVEITVTGVSGATTTVNGVTEYSGAKIVSTGVPAFVYYHRTTNASTAASTWWGTVAQVRTLYGDTYADAGYDYNNSGYPNCFAAAGMLKNFTSIPFTANTSSPTENNGGYKAITNSDPVTGTTNTTNGSIFITSKAKTTDEVPNSKETATTVHALTQEELNTARGLGTTSTTSTATTDGATGLFFLRNLKNENTAYGYDDNKSPYYWLASPNTSNRGEVWSVNDNGNFGSNYRVTRGVRPVVSLNSNIYKDGDVWKIR